MSESKNAITSQDEQPMDAKVEEEEPEEEEFLEASQ
jgi:hypothetical protein